MKYYTLLTLEGSKWCIQFGDYEKDVVKDEQQDSYQGYKCKIICTKDNQKAIEEAVHKLNLKG